MNKLTILEFPDPRLRTRATPVEGVDDDLRALIDAMFETMYAAPGIGLAATQVDVHKRLLVTDVSADKTEPLCFINPEIIDREGSVEFLTGHFKETFLSSQVNFMLVSVTLLELISGVLSIFGIISLVTTGSPFIGHSSLVQNYAISLQDFSC